MWRIRPIDRIRAVKNEERARRSGSGLPKRLGLHGSRTNRKWCRSRQRRDRAGAVGSCRDTSMVNEKRKDSARLRQGSAPHGRTRQLRTTAPLSRDNGIAVAKHLALGDHAPARTLEFCSRSRGDRDGCDGSQATSCQPHAHQSRFGGEARCRGARGTRLDRKWVVDGSGSVGCGALGSRSEACAAVTRDSRRKGRGNAVRSRPRAGSRDEIAHGRAHRWRQYATRPPDAAAPSTWRSRARASQGARDAAR